MTKTPAPESNDDSNSVMEIETLCGRVLKIHVHAPALTLLELRVCIEDQLGFTPEFNKMLVNHRELSETDIVQVEGSRMQLQHNLYGGTGGAGAPVNFQIVKQFPDALQCRCLCQQCGVQNFPDFNGDWCTEACFCLHAECGLLDCKQQQCCCILASTQGVKAEKTMPRALNCRCLLWKCGIKNFPDLKTEAWCFWNALCLHSECGLKDWQYNQWLCLKCTLNA